MAANKEIVDEIMRKVEREQVLINNAVKMRGVANPQVQASLDAQIKEGQRNLKYLEERLQQLSMNSQSAPGGPGGQGQSGPGGRVPKPRPNYSRLDLIKADTPHLGPRYQLMLSQLAFKLDVEKKYKEGIEKVVRLYDIDGDKKSSKEAEGRRIECNQKIALLTQALRRYEDLNIGVGMMEEGGDEDSINQPQGRRSLSGFLDLKIIAIKDVQHAIGGSAWGRRPASYVQIKVEDNLRGTTKQTKNDRWTEERHTVEVDKANEVELTVYDIGAGMKYPSPIGMVWVRLSDVVEEMRRKKIEQELAGSQWFTAEQMPGGGPPGGPGGGGPGGGQGQFGGPPGQFSGHAGGGMPAAGVPGAGVSGQTGSDPNGIEAWFSLEPVGSILLSISFVKQSRGKPAFDLGLNRKGAVRRKEEVQERYGHKFVSQQFFNIMRCALCGEFLKYNAGMQCEDCKYLCHQKCYHKVVTKCISKSNAETDPDEVKINHRIPHRFEPFNNFSANWCCHCGYLLPVGKRNARKCSDENCGLTCHASCQHLVPDFCGLPMDRANAMLATVQSVPQRPLTDKPKLRETLRPAMPTSPASYQSSGTGDSVVSPPSSRTSYPSESTYQQPHGDAFSAAANALRPNSGSAGPGSPPHGQQQRPPMGARQPSEPERAAATAMDPNRQYQSQAQQQRQSAQGYPPQSNHPAYNPADYHRFENQPPPNQYGQPQQQQQQQQQQGQMYGAPADTPQVRVNNGPPYEQQQQQQQSQPVQKQQPASQAQQPPQQQQQQQPQQQQQQQVAAKRASQQQKPQRRIGLEHFNFLAVLGKGNFGKVMLAETKSTKKLYAIKVLKKEFIIENDEVESTRSEKRVFLVANKERHPFLLNLHACFQTETRIYFVMDYISGGDLMLHIQRGHFGLKRSVFYASEVCLALKYFHENGVIYRDLKLDNILLTMDGHIKIADYGLCKEDMWYGKTTGTFCGTPEFMAPEILLDKKYGRAVDWWAFGVLIYQMLLQQSPFRGEDEDEIYDAILADEPLYPIHMPRDSVSVLQKLLTREPEHRLGSGPSDAQEVMSQPFFKSVNWDDVRNKRIPPPYLPQIKNATDTSNFDNEFTSVTPVLTPVQSVLTQQMQEEFRGFSYTGDFD